MNPINSTTIGILQQTQEFKNNHPVITVALSVLGGAGLTYIAYKYLSSPKQMQIADIEGFNGKSDQWLIGYTELAKTAKMREQVEKTTLRGRDIRTIDLSGVEIPSESSQKKNPNYVQWNAGRVSESRKIFSGGYTACFAILGRGYKNGEGSSIPDYFYVHHFFSRSDFFKETLSDLVTKVGSGTVELFISGGQAAISEWNYEEIKSIIKESSTDTCKVKILDDTSNIADHEDPLMVYQEGNTVISNQVSPNIAYTGFDKFGNPIQVLHLSDRGTQNKEDGHSSKKFLGVKW